MSARDNFTEAEWKLIVAAAPMVGVAVASASPNGPWGIMKEMLSVGMAMTDVVREGSDNGLINALIEDIKARATKPERPGSISNAEQAMSMALAHIDSVQQLVDSKAAGDAAEFKLWLLDIGHRVAEASNEGGFFGFGGPKVSDAERDMLSQIASTLRIIDPGALA